jgi:hypothetical protein
MSGITRPTERSVSDLIGFILMFSIIASSVSLIYLVGFDTLEDFSDDEDVQTADRAMRGVAETFEDIHRQGVPERSLDVGIDGANLDLVESGIELRVKETTGPGSPREFDIETNALTVSRSGSADEIAYESGALFQVGEQGSIIRHRPVFSCEGGTAILSVVQLTGSVSISVEDPVQVTGRQTETRRLYPSPGSSPKATEITIDVTDSRYASAWDNYLDRLGSEQDWVQDSNGVYTCNVNRVYIRQTTINVEAID